MPLLAAFLWPGVSAPQDIPLQDEIVVTATRQPSASVRLPVSVDRINVEAIRAGLPLIEASELLNRVPGIVVQNRQNFAQDTQISARGFGARASFGIRGLKLFVDDIPACIPDGQGQGAFIPLFVIDIIEVLRGPWAVPFGNAAGGVISAQSIAPGRAPQVEFSFAAGQDRTRVTTLQAGAASDGVAGRVAAQRFTSDGFRAHSQVQREQTYARLDIALGPEHRLRLVGNLIHQPETGDPLGLTRAQFDIDARQAPAAAIAFNTRKSIDHQQVGAIVDGGTGTLAWKLLAYGGNREVEQFLSTPVASQAPAASAGGVVALDRQFHGVGLKVSASYRAWSWAVGLDADQMRESRQGYENFIATAAIPAARTLGVRGRLRRDEVNTQTTLDGYAYLDWAIASKWSVHTAIRSNRISFDSNDQYIVAGNGDDSGERRYSRITPAMALVYSVNPASNLYASASTGFETPTAAELAYRPDRSSGLNFGLAASTNRQFEIGFKQRHENAAINIAAFLVDSNDEIVPATSTGGRTTFQNGGRTSRRGFESSIDWRLPEAAKSLALRFAYTFLDAAFRDGYLVQDAGGRSIASGAAMPAIPRHQLFVEAAWRRGLPGFSAAVEWQARSRVFADDANTASAPGYGVVHARAAYRIALGSLELQPFMRIENIFNKKYISSVIVNEASQRFFESAPTRRWLAGVSGIVRF